MGIIQWYASQGENSAVIHNYCSKRYIFPIAGSNVSKGGLIFMSCIEPAIEQIFKKNKNNKKKVSKSNKSQVEFS